VPHLNKSLAQFNKKPFPSGVFSQGFITQVHRIRHKVIMIIIMVMIVRVSALTITITFNITLTISITTSK